MSLRDKAVTSDNPTGTRGDPRITLLATALGFFTITLDTTIVNVALPTIGRQLGGGVASLQWVVDGYTLAFAALLLSTGALSDRLGAFRCFGAGVAMFTVASITCGLSPSMPVLLGSRAVQGAGAALMLPASLALIRQAYHDERELAKAVAVWTSVGGVAVAAGPVLGGLLTSSLGWRAIFFVNVPVGALALIALTRAPRSVPRPTAFDVAGQTTAIAALAALIFGVIEAGNRGLAAPLVIASLALFVVASVVFLIVENRSRHPMVPLSLFRSRIVSTTTVTGLTINMAFYGLVFVLSLYFQQILGHSVLIAGLMFVPMAVLISSANLTAGKLSARFGPRLPMTVGQLLLVTGLVALLWVGSGTSTVTLLIVLIPLGVGSGLIVPPLTSALLKAVDRDQAGTASGILSAARQVGGAFGVALFGAFVANHATFLHGLHLDALIGALAVGATTIATIFLIPRNRKSSPDAPSTPGRSG
jgi:DHA2 family methylenomycin A resistance protein-like MFS transporter